MKLRIEQEEWWPVYEPSDWGLIEIDINPALAHRIHYAFKEFEEIQRILRDEYEHGVRVE